MRHELAIAVLKRESTLLATQAREFDYVATRHASDTTNYHARRAADCRLRHRQLSETVQYLETEGQKP